MRGPPYGVPPLAGAAVGALSLLGASLEADVSQAHSLGSALIYEWGAPTLALAALAGGGKALAASYAPPSAPSASGDGARAVPRRALLPLRPAAALRRDADSAILALPACLLLNGAALTLIASASAAPAASAASAASVPAALALHQHALCWALDWIVGVPATLFIRAGTLFLHPDTHFSHMSHTPFPHISECNSSWQPRAAASTPSTTLPGPRRRSVGGHSLSLTDLSRCFPIC